MPIEIDILTDELKRDEGYEGTVYTCSAGKLTIGYGHNIEDVPLPKYIAEKLLQHDIMEAYQDCEQIDWFHSLSAVRQRVIINMVFNLGLNGVLKFKKMIQAIKDKDYERASVEMLDSKWHQQVGMRAKRLSYMMEYDSTYSTN